MSELPNHPNLFPNEVQKFLRVSRSTLYKWLEEGVIPSKKINGIYRIPRQEFLDWYDKQSSTPVFQSA